MKCELCGREFDLKEAFEIHHLDPKARGKKGNKIIVCTACGDQIHQLFSNKELSVFYNTLESLLENENIQKWIKWIGKKNFPAHVCMKKKKRK